ncbi:MAG: ROK family protein [Planctomycetaceae bacterium]|nr:ROK family protein [Planctomycetaceae bacterium]
MADTTDRNLWLGFDLGGTKMLAQVYDDDFKLLGKARKKTKASADSESGIDRIAGLIDEALADAQVTAEQLAGIGIGCPGPVDMDHGVVCDPPNLAWKDVPVRKLLQQRFPCPVAVLNDVDAGVYGEYRFGAGKKARCVLGIFSGTGIGGGCVYQGQILTGKRHSCMEIGHIQVTPRGPLCGCGRRGCLEALASRLAIAANAAKCVFRGEAPKLKEIAGTDLMNIRSGAIAQSVKAGDVAIERLVQEAARHLGIAVASIVHLLAPDVVVLGGGLVESLPDMICKIVQEDARKRVMPAFADEFKVVVASLGDDAGAMGAAGWAKHVIGEHLAVTE